MSHEVNKLINRAEALLELNRASDAIPILLKILASDPQNFYATCSLSRCYYDLTDYEKALEFAEKAITISPDNEWGHRLRSLTLGELNRKKEALKSALASVKLAPDDPSALLCLVNAQVECTKLDEAKETAKKLLEISPDTEESQITAGNVHLSLREYYLAEKHFREALRINPTSYYARNNLGVVNLKRNIEDEYGDYTIDDFAEAVRLDPSNEIAIENLRIQFSILPQLSVYVVLLPITIMGFFIFPIISAIFLISGFYQVIKTLIINFKNRHRLSKEFRTLFKSESYKKRLNRSVKTFLEITKEFVLKLKLAYILCFIGFSLRLASLESDSTMLYVISFLLFAASIYVVHKKLKE